MVSCYDCEHFGGKCNGIVPPMEFRDCMDESCALFVMASWRTEMYKPRGKVRIS
jgi:hypothetical protein